MNDVTLIELRAIKECGSVNNIPVTPDMVKAAKTSHQLYVQHLKQEQLKKWQKAIEKQEQAGKKWKVEECKQQKGGCMKEIGI